MAERWRIKTGDLVSVISGKNKNVRGKILSVNRENRRITVEGVNVVKKHKKPTSQSPGIIETKNLSIHASKVMLIDPTLNIPVRVGTKVENGKKVRFSKKSNEIIQS